MEGLVAAWRDGGVVAWGEVNEGGAPLIGCSGCLGRGLARFVVLVGLMVMEAVGGCKGSPFKGLRNGAGPLSAGYRPKAGPIFSCRST